MAGKGCVFMREFILIVLSSLAVFGAWALLFEWGCRLFCPELGKCVCVVPVFEETDTETLLRLLRQQRMGGFVLLDCRAQKGAIALCAADMGCYAEDILHAGQRIGCFLPQQPSSSEEEEPP